MPSITISVGSPPDSTGSGATDAQNAGVGGVGIVASPSKVASALQFKSINAGSSKVTVTNDVANKEVDIDIDPSQIAHASLGGVGTNSHATIDAQLPTAAQKAAMVGTGTPGAGNPFVSSDDSRLATPAAAAALAGTSGTPGDTNRFVTDADARNTNARAPTSAAAGQLGGTYPSPDVRGLRETGGPTLLTIGTVADGAFLRRSGATVIGSNTVSADTIVNAGTGGISVIPSPAKIGDDLQVKSVASSSARLTVTDNVGNKRVDLDVIETAIQHQNLAGAGTLTHADLDLRAPSTSEKTALLGSFGAPGSLNKYVTALDPRVPTSTQVDALVGTSGTPGSGNLFVTDADTRNTNARVPAGAAGGGNVSGTYPNPSVVGVTETSGPTSLSIGAIPDGQFLQRSGTSVVGSALAFATAVGLDANSTTGAGSGADYARATHTHAISSAGTLSPIQAGDTSLAGSAVGFANKAHRHAIAVDVPVDVGTANVQGNSLAFSAANHVHSHGDQAGGTLHALAGAAPGFMSAAQVTKLAGIEDAAQVTSFARVQTALAGATSDVSINSVKLANVAAGTADTDAVNRLQLTTVGAGLQLKEAVRVATVSTIANLASVPVAPFQAQGVTLVAGDRVLVQHASSSDGVEATSAKREGIYVVGTLSLGNAPFTRALDADSNNEVKTGLTVYCAEGTHAGTSFALSTVSPIVLDTTLLTFTSLSSLAALVAGDGINKTGNTIDLDLHADASLIISGGQARVGVLATDAQHGNRGGGALHSDATTGASGFMSAAMVTKLNAIENSATADQTITAGSGLTGGGTGDVTLSVNYGTVANTVTAGNDSRLPTDDQKAALAGTSGTAPSASNKFVDNADPRLIGSGPPSGVAGGQLGGTYPNPDVRGLRETSGPTLLTLGAVSDGQVLLRSGASVIGGSVAALTGTAPVDVDASAASVGSGGTAAKHDHKHNVSTGTPTGVIAIGAIADDGISASLSRIDHVHPMGSPGAPADIAKVAAAAGASVIAAREDHQHSVSTAAPIAVQPGDAGAEGSATSLARSNHQHTVTTGNPETIGTVNSTGSSTGIPRLDHVHAHGDQTVDTLHALAVAGTSHGFMSSSDKTKIDTVAAGSTANSTDAFLLSRANHTGQQALSTLTDASSASILMGRGSAGGAGSFQQITLDPTLVMTGTVLSAPSGGAPVGAAYLTVGANGTLTNERDITAITSTLAFKAADTLTLPLSVQGFTGSSYGLQEWINSTGAISLAIAPTCDIFKAGGHLVIGPIDGSYDLRLLTTSGTFTLNSPSAASLNYVGFGSLTLGTTVASGGNLIFKSNDVSSWQITPSGALQGVGGNRAINNVSDPASANDASNKGYTDGLTYVTAGDGIVRTGATLDVDLNADGSLAISATKLGVGVLATDAQHGTRGGGTSLHPNATTSVSGFHSAADKTAFDSIAGAAILTVGAVTGLSSERNIAAIATNLEFQAADTSTIPIAFKQFTGSSQNLTEWRNSAGTAVLKLNSVADTCTFDGSGNFTIGTGSTSGGNLILKANAVNYWQVASTGQLQGVGGNRAIQNVLDPVNDQDGVSKVYVDSLPYKRTVKAATTGNITLSGTQTIDGVSLSANDLCLVWQQTSGADNGLYIVSAGAWTRTTDADTSAKMTLGSRVLVHSGNKFSGVTFVLTNQSTITLGATSLTFIPVSPYIETNQLIPQFVGVSTGATSIAATTTFVGAQYTIMRPMNANKFVLNIGANGTPGNYAIGLYQAAYGQSGDVATRILSLATVATPGGANTSTVITADEGFARIRQGIVYVLWGKLTGAYSFRTYNAAAVDGINAVVDALVTPSTFTTTIATSSLPATFNPIASTSGGDAVITTTNVGLILRLLNA